MAKRTKQERALIRQWHSIQHFLDYTLIHSPTVSPEDPPKYASKDVWLYHLKLRLGKVDSKEIIEVPAPFRLRLCMKIYPTGLITLTLNREMQRMDAAANGSAGLLTKPDVMRTYWKIPNYERDCRPDCRYLQQIETVGRKECVMRHLPDTKIRALGCPPLRNELVQEFD